MPVKEDFTSQLSITNIHLNFLASRRLVLRIIEKEVKDIPCKIINQRVLGFQEEHFTLSKLLTLVLLISILEYILTQCTSV